MNSHEQDIELIERFFRQELKGDELLAFENRVLQDPEFSKEVIQMRDIFYSVRMAARKELKEELKEIQNEALSQPVKPYKPRFKWLKWIKGLIICGVIGLFAFTLMKEHNLDRIKSMFIVKDSTMVSDTFGIPPGNPEGGTIIKDPSDPRYYDMEADFKLQVKDPNSFKIKKTGMTEDGLYQYEIEADGQKHKVISSNPELTTELLKRKDATKNDSIPISRKTTIKTQNEKPDQIEGVDF